MRNTSNCTLRITKSTPKKPCCSSEKTDKEAALQTLRQRFPCVRPMPRRGGINARLAYDFFRFLKRPLTGLSTTSVDNSMPIRHLGRLGGRLDGSTRPKSAAAPQVSTSRRPRCPSSVNVRAAPAGLGRLVPKLSTTAAPVGQGREGLGNGVLSQNRRNFRHPSSSPATSASRSIILPSLWKV